MKIVKKILVGLLIVLVVLQFYRPEKNESGYESVMAFENETQPTDEIKAILKTKCYDCHSNQTTYPWYAEVSPVSLWLDDHIRHGKGHFNASEWTSYPVKKKDHKLEELVEMVEEREMPLDSYTWIHGDITEQEREMLITWATTSRLRYSVQLSE